MPGEDVKVSRPRWLGMYLHGQSIPQALISLAMMALPLLIVLLIIAFRLR